jgi:multisubunit Na+/H+ antiporter MnhB subunit
MGLLWTLLTAHAAPPAPQPPPEELLQDARRLTRTGGLELGGGLAAAAGGVVVLLVGRGEPGSISTETQATSDVRSIGGASLLVVGLGLSLVGGNTLGRASALRDQARSLQVTVAPGGVGLQGRF